MRVVFALAAFVALAAAHHGGQHLIPDLFEGQREYVYNYRSLVATGLPQQSQRYAGLEKYGVLTVQVHEQQGNTKVLGFRLGHVMSGSFDKEVEDVENRRIEGVSHSIEETIEKYGPVFVKIQDNEVQKLKTPQGMPEEIINIYRGIAALFTVGKPEQNENHPFMFQQQGKQQGEQQPIVYRRQEQGIVGNFETIYEVLSNPEQTNFLNVTKTRNYMKHLGRDGRYIQNGHDERGCKNVCPTHKPEQLDKNMQPETTRWEKPTAEGCPVNFHPKKDLVEAFTTYNYNMTVEKNGQVALIEEAKALDKKVLPLRKQQIQTISLLKLKLVQERPISQLWEQKDANKQYDDVTYRFPEGHKFDLEYLSLYNKNNNGEMLKEQIIPMIKALSEIIVSDNIELKGRTGDKIVQLTMALGALNKKELQSLWTVIGQSASGKAVSELEKIERKVLVDTVALSGSNYAAEFLVELIKEQKLTILETVHTLETFQKNIVKPTTKIMNELLNVCTDAKFQEKRTIFSTACVAFAEIVRGNCGNHKVNQWQKEWQQEQHQHEQVQFCGQQEYTQFVEIIRGQLHNAQEFAQQTVYIQTLGRLGHPEAIKALIPYVYGEQEVIAQVEKMNRNDKHEDNSEYVQFLRQVAIYSLHHAAKNHGAAVQPIVQGIYFNKQEKYELRTAALSVLLATQPTESTFGRIVIELGKEQDLEVASYTYSALRTLANTTLPCMQQTARYVQNVIGALPQKTFGVHHSKWATFTKYFPLANLGLKGQWELTQSNVSAIPRAFYAGLTTNKGPFVSTVGEIGMIAKGFENLDKVILRQGGMKKIVENVMQRIRRDARTFGGDESVEKMIEQLEQTMQFNTEENYEQPRAVVFGNFLGNELYMPVDKEYMTKVAKKAGERFVKILREEGSEKTFRFVRILMPRTYVQVAPGVNGLPVILSNRHPIVVSLSLKDLQTRFGAEKGQLKLNPFVAAVSGLIQPTVYHTSIHSAFTINPVGPTRVAHGVRAVEQTYVTLPIDLSVQYTHQTKTVAFTLRPRFEKVFFHKTNAVTFKTEALLIRPVEMPLLERYTTIKTQQKPFVFERVLGEKLGMALRVQGLSMNEEYATNFLRSRVAREQGVMTALIKEIANEWFVPRTWAVRVEQNEQKPVEEIKMIFRFGNLLKDRMHEQNKEQKLQKEQHLSQEQLAKEQAYPEHMRMVAYEQEYEKITGRKPETQKLEQALERIVKKTEKYWSQVERELRQKLNKENSQVRSIEYVISAKGEKKQPLAITGHVILASTLSKQAKLAEIKMNVEKRPISFEAQAISAFTQAPQPFETEVREQEQRGIVGFVAELETRLTGKQQYSGKFEMTKSEEQKQQMKLGNEQKPWYHRQCEEDKKERKAEVSTACEMTRLHKSALNQIRFEIELPQQIHERLTNASHQIREALKVRLYRNLRATYDHENTKTQENKIQGELVYSEQYPEMRMANLTLRTPDHEELRFERIAVPKALRPNTMWSLKEQAKAILKNERPEPVCIYNGQKLRTFDNVTVSLEKAMKEGQKYVIARDNDEQSKFTIVAEKKQSGETQVEILLRDATLVKLTPAGQQTYKVRVNQTELEVSAKESQVRQYASKGKHMITFHVEEHKEGKNTLVVKVRDQRMRIVYDGQNLKVEIAKRQAKGQLTGLCGDMNNQHLEELTGPRGCNFERHEDFVRAFALTHEQQGKIEGKWMCPQGIYPRGASQEEISKKQHEHQLIHQKKQMIFQQRQTLRQEHNQFTEETKMVPLAGKICFSVEPVQACKHGYRQVQSELQTVAFTCLQANQPRTIQLQREVQTQKVALNLPVGRVAGLVHHEIEVATRCAH